MSSFDFDDNISLDTFFEGRISVDRLEKMLSELNHDFVPSLNNLVSIHQYSRKIASHGCVVIANNHKEERDVGLIAFYANIPIDRYAFITSLGVLPDYYGTGLSKILLIRAIDMCLQRGYKRVALEVSQKNERAMKFYSKFGFVQKLSRNMVDVNSVFMVMLTSGNQLNLH